MNEFELIAAINRYTSHLPDNGFEGIGDDCAVLPLGDEALVFTTDALSEGVHFLTATTSAIDLGHKALAVNLSDVAAMGVRPVAVLLTLSLPREIEEHWVLDFMVGFAELAQRYGVALIGGDTTRSEGGIQISVTAIGRGPLRHIKRRSAAQVGDIILVSDRLGGSAAGLRQLWEGKVQSPEIEQHRRPMPEVEVGAWLGAREEVHAMMDLSDGLKSDLRHILNASQVGAEVQVNNIPRAANTTLGDCWCGGEDYKLLLTADPRQAGILCEEFKAQFGRNLAVIGHITEQGLRWFDHHQEVSCDYEGFSHF